MCELVLLARLSIDCCREGAPPGFSQSTRRSLALSGSGMDRGFVEGSASPPPGDGSSDAARLRRLARRSLPTARRARRSSVLSPPQVAHHPRVVVDLLRPVEPSIGAQRKGSARSDYDLSGCSGPFRPESKTAMPLLLFVLTILVLSGGAWALTSNVLALIVVVLLTAWIVGMPGRRYYRRRSTQVRDRVRS